jgi:hypothetical protein
MSTRTASGPQPLELPAGCRLVGEHLPDGRTYTVTLVPVESHPWGVGHVPATVCGDFPQRPKAPRKAKCDDSPTLFKLEGKPLPLPELPVIVVYAQPGCIDQAHAFANVLFRRGYNAEARLDPEATDARP